ncbi:MAG TPA: SPFH domain-containing protein [Anaerolineae bacterium]|nr:SPFH domain-containing protein [Anaerolineae bacterium]
MPRIIDVVEFVDETENEIVHRIPERGSGDFRFGSNVIVRESQVAIFFRDGKALDVFEPGKHVISTANIPLLIDLLKLGTSGKTPFTAEAYFVSMREFIDKGWGTPEPITMRDADLGMVRLRANGTYNFEVSDPSLFVNKIVGTQGIYETPQVENLLRGLIISRLTDLLGEMKKSLLDLPAMYDEIGAATKAKAEDDFAARGLRLKTLYVRSISPTEDTAKAIDERAQMGAIGDMAKYIQFQAARGIRDAAQSPSGGVAGAGVGLGAGLGLGQMMAGAMAQSLQAQPQQPQAQQAAAAPAPDVMTPAEAAAYLKVTEEEIKQMIDSGEIKAKKVGKSFRIAKKTLDDFLAS